MPSGPGKYSEYAVRIAEETDATLVIVCVLGGKRGPGFDVACGEKALPAVPNLLRVMADEIERAQQHEAH